MIHAEAVSTLFPKLSYTLFQKCKKRHSDCLGSQDQNFKRKTFFHNEDTFMVENLETRGSSTLPGLIKTAASITENVPQSSLSSRSEELSAKECYEGILTKSNKGADLLEMKQENALYNDSPGFIKNETNTNRSGKKSPEDSGKDDLPLVTNIPIGGKEFIASVLATTSEEPSCPNEIRDQNLNTLALSSKHSKDKVIQLSGDHTYFEFKSPKKKVILKITKNPVKPTEKIKTLEELLDLLRKENYVTSDACSMIEAFLDLPNGLMRNKSQSFSGFRPQMSFTKGVEKFASTIYFHAPRAYEFVSKIFLLPDPSVIRNSVRVWNYFPGFTQESLSLLKKGFCNSAYASKLCTIMMVNTKIKEHLEFDVNTGRSLGHVDFGGGLDPQDSDEVRTASDALLFVAVGLGSNWKLPFGYFLNNSLSGEFLKTLVTEAIIALEECNLEVRAVVCDGCGSCLSLSNLFGCRINVKSFRDIETSFPHPTRRDIKVQLIYDASYGLKLLSNLLANKGSLHSTTYGKIEWKYLSLLLEDSKIEHKDCNWPDFQEFYRQKMKVRIGCHSIGNSIGKTLELIENQYIEEFQGYSATANFAADIDRAFDTLNSRNPVAPGERTPMYQYTVEEQKESLTFVARRIMGLELMTGKRVVDEGRRMSVISFSSTLKAVCQLASDLVNRNIIKYLCTYRLNLQHAEVILSCLQRTGNWNGLPSASEFQISYKKVIETAGIIACNSAIFTVDFEGENITVGQGTIYPYRNILKVPELRVNSSFNKSFLSILDYKSEIMSRAKLISRYVAGKLACSDCIEILLDDEYDSICRSSATREIHIIPSMYVLNIVLLCEKILKVQMLQHCHYKMKDFVVKAFGDYAQLNIDLGVKQNSILHYVEEPHHVICLTKTIIFTFIQLKYSFSHDFR